MRLGVLATHPIQYHAPLYRELAKRLDLHVYFAHRQTAEGQARAGFGVAFEWDVPLLEGYPHSFLRNRSPQPDTGTWGGCHTPEIAGIIARERFDAFLVTGWYNRSFQQAIRACRATATPLMVRGDSQLVTPTSPAWRLAREVVYRRFIPGFDRYLVVGKRNREYYLHFGADAARMTFVPHFVDNARFAERAAAADPDALRREAGAGPDALLLLFVGKLIPKKRPADLIRATAELRRRGIEAVPVFVGSGQLEGALRREAEVLGVRTHFTGFRNQSELPASYAGADLLVLPSDGGETWGLVVNEAMACGTPAVVSDRVGCGPDLIEPGKTGEVFPMGDAAALAGAVERMLPRLGTAATATGLADKMAVYSVETAVEGILEALGLAAPRSRKSQVESRKLEVVASKA